MAFNLVETVDPAEINYIGEKFSLLCSDNPDCLDDFLNLPPNKIKKIVYLRASGNQLVCSQKSLLAIALLELDEQSGIWLCYSVEGNKNLPAKEQEFCRSNLISHLSSSPEEVWILYTEDNEDIFKACSMNEVHSNGDYSFYGKS